MADLDAQAVMLANRLRKNAKRLKSWCKREGVTCFRLYDRDIPEVALVVDVYEDNAHVAIYARRERDETFGDRWVERMVEAIGETLELPKSAIFVKTRERQRGDDQYGRFADAGVTRVVHEGGLAFLVNLSDYLDTGLFLDHRTTRALVRDESRGKRVLNLFAYTGSFSVYAASGGAASVTTVDLSNTYTDWAEQNLALNGFTDARFRTIRADVLGWLDAYHPEKYDLIVLDPPTFSTSKKMSATWDVQRDHESLLRSVSRLTAPGAAIWFSTNRKGFKLGDLRQLGDTVDMTGKTLPEDFRGRTPHQCWRIAVR